MPRIRSLPALAAILIAVLATTAAQARHTHRDHAAHRSTPAPYVASRPPYIGCAYDAAGNPSCYAPDGTPYAPDIIGGPNHVGDGGPAANFF